MQNSPSPPRYLVYLVIGAVTVLFLGRNLPWTLDDYDQAKQAVVSLEILQDGHVWFQHLPRGGAASKPPLMGWLSVGFYEVVRNWDWAWRLPSILSAFVLAAGLGIAAQRIWRSDWAALLTVAAFSFNMFTVRLASLVRTDMLLALLISAGGLLILRQIHEATPWSPKRRWAFGAILLAACLTKGPIVYAFLLPGVVAHVWIAKRRGETSTAWSGWLSWMLPLVPFLIWAGAAIASSSAFYDDVVSKEFLGRFQSGEDGPHQDQPFYFYVPHLLQKTAPWLIIPALLLGISPRLRQELAKDRTLLWILLWFAGGFLVMTLIPSKRPDRIYPVVAPLSLLAAWSMTRFEWKGRLKLGTVCQAAIYLALIAAAAYSFMEVRKNYLTRRDLFAFQCRQAHAYVLEHHLPLGVVLHHGEGLLPYTLRTPNDRLSASEAAAQWREGKIAAILISEAQLAPVQERLGAFQIAMKTAAPEKGRSPYVLIVRK